MMKRRALLPLIVLLTVVASATAQNGELGAAKKKIQALLSQAEELMQAGRVNQAERVRNQAKEVQAMVARAESRAREGDGREPRRDSDDFHGLFDHLEHAVAALRKLGRDEQADELSAHARELRQSFRRQDRERLQWELDVFRFAKEMYSEMRKEDLVELVERSMHAREIEHARPSVGNEVELLNYAAKLYAKRGGEEKAAALAKLGEQLSREMKPNEERREKRLTERQAGMQQLEFMQYAAGVLKKARRPDAAESMHRAATAMKLKLEGRRDEEAQTMIRRSPGRRAIAEHFFMTAEILEDQRDREHAQAVAKMGKQFAAQAERIAKHEQSEVEQAEVREARQRRTDANRLDQLRSHVAELERILQELQEASKKSKRRRNR